MKRLMASVAAALAIFTLSETAQANHVGGHGPVVNKGGNGTMRGGSGSSRAPNREYGRDWKGWTNRFYCKEFGCYLYWCEESRWWYRYDERHERYHPLSEEYRPRNEK